MKPADARDRSMPRNGKSQANVNVLNPDGKSDMAESRNVHSIEVSAQASP